jgi:hypothetical protein
MKMIKAPSWRRETPVADMLEWMLTGGGLCPELSQGLQTLGCLIFPAIQKTRHSDPSLSIRKEKLHSVKTSPKVT